MLLDGKTTANKIIVKLKEELASLKPATRPPGLAFILTKNHKPSLVYVSMKKRACDSLGIFSVTEEIDPEISENELIALIEKFNKESAIDGILVQQPLPRHIDEQKILEAIDPSKDVDGFHPLNIGKALLGFEDGFIACTPLGIVRLLKEYHISAEKKHVLIIGRSNIVGKPLASLLVQKKPLCNATVTLAHSHTTNLETLCKQADIIVAAIGKERFIKKEMVKTGAVVIDVGINLISENGMTKLVGDVDFENVKNQCSFITPVPGGVGPMTIAMLMSNLIQSYKKKIRG